jgi:hypothetical protein
MFKFKLRNPGEALAGVLISTNERSFEFRLQPAMAA